jgi:hypothetical protein
MDAFVHEFEDGYSVSLSMSFLIVRYMFNDGLRTMFQSCRSSDDPVVS